MNHYDKPFLLKEFRKITAEERNQELVLIKEKAKKEGRCWREVSRIATFRLQFAKMDQGDFYDQKLVESRKNGEDYMDFIRRMKLTHLAH